MHFNEVKFQHAATQTYLGSPSLVRMPEGALLAVHDYFGPGSPRNHERKEHLTSVYRSRDDGRTWTNVTHIANAYWSTLFLHRGSLYLLGISQKYGSIVIRRSEDGGNTWTHPEDAHTGLLFRGGPRETPPNYHCAPMPILHSGGRLYRAVEDCTPCAWPTGFRAAVISIDDDADLLDADQWTMSNTLAIDPAWVPPTWKSPISLGWLEGNMVETPGGALWNILRVHSEPDINKAAIVQVHDQGRRITFDPADGFIDFPGGMTKFTIRRDPTSGLYLTLSNPTVAPGAVYQRNVLALCESSDLRHWEIRHVLLEDDSPLSPEDSLRFTGFQYVDWHFDGKDIIYLVRTAYDGAHNFHDSNHITYHVLPEYRQYCSAHPWG